MKYDSRFAIFLAILAAILYAINIPFSKILLDSAPPTMMAAFLYLGAGIGMGTMMVARRKSIFKGREANLVSSDLPFVVAMVVLDIAAPILLMFGLKHATAANVSLLNNFEIVATALIAMMFFREKVTKTLWMAIGFVTIACMLLTVETNGVLSFSVGSLLVIGATVCWGLENNCTRQIADKDPMQIVTIKGFGSGFGALLISVAVGEAMPRLSTLLLIAMLGFVSYGLSIYVYTYAQRGIGAAKTSTYYAVAPFVGTLLSIIFLNEHITPILVGALVLMAIGAWLAAK